MAGHGLFQAAQEIMPPAGSLSSMVINIPAREKNAVLARIRYFEPDNLRFLLKSEIYSWHWKINLQVASQNMQVMLPVWLGDLYTDCSVQQNHFIGILASLEVFLVQPAVQGDKLVQQAFNEDMSCPEDFIKWGFTVYGGYFQCLNYNLSRYVICYFEGSGLQNYLQVSLPKSITYGARKISQVTCAIEVQWQN